MSFLGSICFYIFIFVLTLFICIFFQEGIKKRHKNRKNLYNILIFLIIAFPLTYITGFRDDSVGRDTPAYSEIYYLSTTSSLEDIYDENNEDYIYKFSLYVFSHIFKSPSCFYMFLQLCILLPLLWIGVNNIETTDLWKPLSIYCFWHFNDSLNMTRQSIAIVWLMVAIELLCKRKIN